MPAGNGQSPEVVAATVELAQITALLQTLLAQERTDVLDVAVADFQYRQLVLDQWPCPGSKRALVYRTGSGTDGLSVPTTGALVCTDNIGRLGGTIVNRGANAVILYLCAAGTAQAGAPAIWLAANGGSWDFRLANMLWAGSVSAVAQTAASTLTVAEV